MYSPSFFLKINAEPIKCTSANLLPATTNHANFTRGVSFGATGSSSDVNFVEYQNDICPEFCPDPSDNKCDPADYSIICDINSDGNFISQSLFTYTINSVGSEY